MVEASAPIRIFSLLEVTQSIQKTLANRYGSVYWIKAEMIKLNHYPHTGHCFPELAEKTDGKIKARMRSTLWSDDFLRINRRFISILREPLKDGIKILFAARISFDPIYGASLHIMDIDPAYTLGDLEREKQETLERLRAEGLLNRNKNLTMPLLPARIAVISVETSKGYADFKRVLDFNPWGYGFFHLLFPAVLQGEKAVASMIHQLTRIQKISSHFDVVAIIRGGGDDLGFSCYNDYRLAREIALFPLPVITGIGHATNETVTDIIASENAITPTKIAEFLLRRFHDFSAALERAQTGIRHRTEKLLLEEKVGFTALLKYFRSETASRLTYSGNLIQRQSVSLIQQTRFQLSRARISRDALITEMKRAADILYLHTQGTLVRETTMLEKQTAVFQQRQHDELENLEKNVANLDPHNVLKRGYSITLLHNKAVKSTGEIVPGDTITTLLSSGSITSQVASTDKNTDHE